MHVARQIAPHMASANASIKHRGEQHFSRTWSNMRPSVKALLPSWFNDMAQHNLLSLMYGPFHV